jgi:hypothetical protein
MPSRGDGPRRTNRVPITMAAFPRSSRSIRREAAHRALAGRLLLVRAGVCGWAGTRSHRHGEREPPRNGRAVRLFEESALSGGCRFVPTFAPAGRSRSAARISPWVRASATVAGAQSPHSVAERVSRGDPQTQSVWGDFCARQPLRADADDVVLAWREGARRAPDDNAARLALGEYPRAGDVCDANELGRGRQVEVHASALSISWFGRRYGR